VLGVSTAEDRKTTGKELVQQRLNNAKKLISRYEAQFAAVVPRHVEVKAFVELALAYVKRSPQLLENALANPASLVLALRECAALGHLPMRGVYALVPLNDNKAPGGKTIVGMEEWRGVVERIYRAGGATSVHVEVGRESDPVLRFQRTRMVLPEHEYDEFAPPNVRGPLKVVYAWARLINGGTSQVVWMPRFEVLRHRAMSRSVTKDNNGGNFWGPIDGEGPNTEAMWRKTALHGLEGLVPTSSAYRWEVAASEAGARGWPGVPDREIARPYGDESSIVDAELVDEAPPPSGEDWPAVAAPGQGAGDAH
jgi:recombination protein RecT